MAKPAMKPSKDGDLVPGLYCAPQEDLFTGVSNQNLLSTRKEEIQPPFHAFKRKDSLIQIEPTHNTIR